MKVIKYPKINDWKALSERPIFEKEQLGDLVSIVLTEVKNKQDRALLNPHCGIIGTA